LGEILAIANGVVITVDPKSRIYDEGCVIVEDDKILDVGKTEEVMPRYRKDKVINAKKKVVLPGFVNLHCHSGLIRGTAEDLPLWEWLKKYVDPTHRVLTPNDAYAASRLCYVESIRSGATTVLDMYRFMDRCADAAEEIGIRAVLAPYVSDKYEYFEKPADNYKLLEKRNGSAGGRIHVWLGLEHLMYCTQEAYEKAAEYAHEYGVGIHTHGEESKEMAEERIPKEYGGRRSTKVLQDYGILGPKTILAHCVWLDDSEIDILAETRTSVAHCPASNMKLASGVARVPELRRRGVCVGLGSDGIKENNRIDIIQEMKLAGLLQKVAHRDATILPATEILKMATIEGARALGMEREIGSLEPGKKADLIIVDFAKPHLTPQLYGKLFNIVNNLVYAAQSSDVSTTIIDGKILMEEQRMPNVDQEKIIEDATSSTLGVLNRREKILSALN
jgi:5-methylthioadenosine/S-adenosylhomocysteine deaminase